MSDELDIQTDEFLKGMACLKAGHPTEGAELLRKAAFAGHAEAQNQLARLYFVTLRTHKDLGDLEASAQSGDHVALFVLAMSFLEGRVVEKDVEKALASLRQAADGGNFMAMKMLSNQQEQA